MLLYLKVLFDDFESMLLQKLKKSNKKYFDDVKIGIIHDFELMLLQKLVIFMKNW